MIVGDGECFPISFLAANLEVAADGPNPLLNCKLARQADRILFGTKASSHCNQLGIISLVMLKTVSKPRWV